MTEHVNMKRNASGYYDETAYKGVMGMAKPGEIWECTNANGTSEYLIIKNHERISTALKLLDFTLDHTIEVGEKSVDPRAVQYIYNDTLSRRTNIVPEEDFNKICCEIAEALDLPSMTVCECAERPEPKSEAAATNSPDDAKMIDEMVKIFGACVVCDFLRCSIYKYRYKGESGKAQWYLNKLGALSLML